MLLPQEVSLNREQLEVITVEEQNEKLCQDETSGDTSDLADNNSSNLVNIPSNIYSSDTNIVRTDNGYRAKLRRTLSTHRFQVCVVSFVIIDCMVVIAELLMDLRILSMEDSVTWSKGSAPPTRFPAESYYLVPDVLHSISIAILAMFVLEICFKIFAFGFDFLKLGWEMFDSVVVTVTFFLDVLLPHSHSSTNGLGLFIILRLWRVARILNGMVKSVKKQADRHVVCEKRRRENLEEELDRYRDICQQQKVTIVQMEGLLKSNGIPIPHF